MAVDLSCYVSKIKEEVEPILEALSAEHVELFPKTFVISRVSERDPVEKEIALEYGLPAQSVFLVSLNDKRAANRVIEVAEMIKQAPGGSNVVILHTNETLI